LPSGWRKSDGAKTVRVGDQVFYNEIDVIKGDIPVRFILISKNEPGPPNNPDTFNITRDKVSVALFRQFFKDCPQIDNARLCLDLSVNKQKNNDHYPIMGVDVNTAHACAHWLGGAQGNLPKRDQWDKAAGLGRKDAGDGPFQGKWEGGKLKIAVRGDPVSMDEPTDDIAPTGCRFMAGNGEEWTRDTTDADKPTVPVEGASASMSVNIRGRNYREAGPLLYSEIRSELGPGSRPYEPKPVEKINMIGFRVVIEP
jgi:formylglycine-generating enzyme required for sulfatase activity